MKCNVSALVCGVALSVFGMQRIFYQDLRSWNFGHLDFGEHHQIFGFFILVIGLLSIYAAIKKK